MSSPPPSSPSSSFSSQPSLCTSLPRSCPPARLLPSAAPSIYKRSRSEFLKRHFHVPCVSLSPSPPPPPHFPILRTSGELSDDKSSVLLLLFRGLHSFFLLSSRRCHRRLFPWRRYCCHYEVGRRAENSNVFLLLLLPLFGAVRRLAADNASKFVSRSLLWRFSTAEEEEEEDERETSAIKCVTPPCTYERRCEIFL